MDPELVAQSLNFHGQTLNKLWESDGQGPNALLNVALRNVDYAVYNQRQKELGIQERSKRLKVQQLIVDKAATLFSHNLKRSNKPCSYTPGDEDVCAVPQPLERFLNIDRNDCRRHFYQCARVGQLLIGQVLQKNYYGVTLKVIATDSLHLRDLRDLGVKAVLSADQIPSGNSYNVGDLLRIMVFEVVADAEKLYCTLRGEEKARLGLITKEDLPASYRLLVEHDGQSYEGSLTSCKAFANPNALEHMAASLGLDLSTENCYSFIGGLDVSPSPEACAPALRQAQNAKWALRSVSDGIRLFKAGQQTEAFQCLNKALSIDPQNVEGLVARGALYANRGNFAKAVQDFEEAIKYKPGHTNAVSYLGETLVAMGKLYELTHVPNGCE